MSNQAINKFNQGFQNPSQLNFSQGGAPIMQGQGNEVVQQAGGGAYLNRAKASQDADPLTTLGLTAAIGYGIGQGMEHFGPKCEGEYSKTILGKLGSWGDKFSTDTKVGRFIERVFRKKDRLIDKWADNSRIGYAMKNHSTRPEWKFAKMPWYGLHGFLSMDTQNVFEQFLKPIGDNVQKLEQYGLKPEEIKNFAQSLAGKSKQEAALLIQLEELRLLGVDPNVTIQNPQLDNLQKIAKELKVKKLGFDSVEAYEAIAKDFAEHPKEVMAAMEKAVKNGDFHISINRHAGGFMAKLKSHFGGRKVSISEYLNKYKAALGKGNTTSLGRALPKSLGWLVEGCTNRFAGGKLAPFMQAFIFADMFYHTYKAPKGEKTKTLAERFVNDFTYFIGATLGLVGIHKIGGLKYLGTDIAGREAYRAAQVAHNVKNAGKGFATKKLWKESKKAVDALLNTKSLKWYEKPLQKLGCLINMGNEHFKPYLSPNKMNMNLLRRIFNTNIIGVPLRIWAVIFAITPILVKATTKTAHAIFGKPTHSVLDEDEENSADPSQAAIDMTNSAPAGPNPQTSNVNNMPNTNLIKQTVSASQNNINNQVNQQQAQNPVNTNNAPQNAPVQNAAPTVNPANNQVAINNNNNNNDNNNTQEPARSYIPSPVGIAAQPQDTSAADKAMADADKAEKQIQSVLAGLYK